MNTRWLETTTLRVIRTWDPRGWEVCLHVPPIVTLSIYHKSVIPYGKVPELCGAWVRCVLCPQLNSHSIQLWWGFWACPWPCTSVILLSISLFFCPRALPEAQKVCSEGMQLAPGREGVNTPLNSPPLMRSGCWWIFAQASSLWRDDSDELSIHFLTIPQLDWAPIAHSNNQLSNVQFITCASRPSYSPCSLIPASWDHFPNKWPISYSFFCLSFQRNPRWELKVVL